jgi:23S rRNA (uracil1939-C5)-methyltransferase
VDLTALAQPPADLKAVVAAAGLTGCTLRTGTGTLLSIGHPVVADPLTALTGDSAAAGGLGRRPGSFFQANRFLVSKLVTAVLRAVPADADVVDLYAGVGLFAIALAATGRGHVTAVEGDPSSGADLRENARPWAASLRAIVGRVEDHLAGHRRAYSTMLIDPPRTGVSKPAMDAIVRHGAKRIVYVSCDPPTMARDSRRLLEAGYRLGPLEGFDLFPNTPHVEVVGVFDR